MTEYKMRKHELAYWRHLATYFEQEYNTLLQNAATNSTAKSCNDGESSLTDIIPGAVVEPKLTNYS